MSGAAPVRVLIQGEHNDGHHCRQHPAGLEEALAYAEGTAGAGRYGVHIPEDIDVKAMRAA
jgi:hypothetical protein